jgi:hypothetical protein
MNIRQDTKRPVEILEPRRTVIPTPRNTSVFPGWGVRI